MITPCTDSIDWQLAADVAYVLAHYDECVARGKANGLVDERATSVKPLFVVRARNDYSALVAVIASLTPDPPIRL